MVLGHCLKAVCLQAGRRGRGGGLGREADSQAPAIATPLWEVAGVSLEDSCICKTVCSSPSKVIRLVSVQLQGAHSGDSDLEPELGWVSFKNTFRRQLRHSLPTPNTAHCRLLPLVGYSFPLQHS